MSLVLMRACRSHVLASTRKCILCLISSKLKVMENLDNSASIAPSLMPVAVLLLFEESIFVKRQGNNEVLKLYNVSVHHVMETN